MPLNHFAELFSEQFPHLTGRRILVALSGGPDSVALLHLLRSPPLDLTLEAVHVHHAIRGTEADDDARFCERLCDRLLIPFHLVHLDPETGRSEGREANWRRGRYRALIATKLDRDLVAIATGHHRDDVTEGTLMQLLRGGGPRAMAGIASETPAGVIRPLLRWTRRQIVDWLRDQNHEWREDSSNLDLEHLRNRVRHVILPELRKVSPGIDNHLVALAGALAADEEYFAHELRRLGLWIDPWIADGGVPLAAIKDLARPIRNRWLHAQAAAVGIIRVSRRQLELADGMLDTGTPRAVTLASRWRFRIARQRLWLEPPNSMAPYSLILETEGTASLPLPGWQIRATLDPHPSADTTWHNFLSTGAEITVRSPAPGDCVAGPGRTIKVSKLLAKHLPRHLRRAWPVCCEDDTIVWIPGIWQGSVTGNLLVEVMTHGRATGSLHR